MGLLDKFTGGDKENVAQQQQQYGKTDAYGQQQRPFQQQDSNTSYGQPQGQYGQQGQQAQQEEKEGWSTKQKVSCPVYPSEADFRSPLVLAAFSPLVPLPVLPPTVFTR